MSRSPATPVCGLFYRKVMCSYTYCFQGRPTAEPRPYRRKS
jgi:hypothetical protein